MRARRARGGAAAGFLLTETLAAFVIGAFVLVALASIAPVVMHAIDVSLARMQDSEDLERTVAALARDIGGLARLRWTGAEPQPFVFRGGPNSLYFVRRIEGGGAASALRVVALREIVTTQGPRLTRSEASWSASASSLEALRFHSTRPIPTGAARLRFTYVPAWDKGKTDPPRSSWASGLRLPEAIVIEAIDATSRRPILTARVMIRANADIGCLGKPGTGAPGTPPPPPEGLPLPAQAAVAATAAPGAPAGPGTDGARFCGRTEAATARVPAPEPQL